MKLWSIIILSCLTAGMAAGCVSVGNQGADTLTGEEKAELKRELDGAMQEVHAELDAAVAEAASALDEAKAEVQEELGESAEWVGDMIRGEGERSRRVIWRKGAAEAEIEDREEFADSLALEEWKAADGSAEGLTEDVTYTVQWEKSIGLLDRWKKEYVDIGSLTLYQDSNLITARIHVLDGIFGRTPKLLGAEAMGEDFDEWFVVVYEVPEEVVESLRV